MGLGCPLLRGSSDRRLRRRAATLPLLLERTLPGSIFFWFFGAVTVAMQGLEEENISFGVFHLSECVVVSGCVGRLPAVEGTHNHWRRWYWGGIWRLRWLRTIIVIICISSIGCYRHCRQDIERIGRQVQVVQAGGTIGSCRPKPYGIVGSLESSSIVKISGWGDAIVGDATSFFTGIKFLKKVTFGWEVLKNS